MPTLEELIAAIGQEKEPEEQNRFFPDPGLNLSTGLGALDLIFGAPARAAQEGILGAVRGDNILDIIGEAGRAGAGFGDEGFGSPDVVHGTKFLKELGVLEDEENIGNIIAGIGTDVATDVLSFNLIGAVRRALGGGVTSFTRSVVSHPGVRRGGKLVKAGLHESRLVKEKALLGMTKEKRRAFLEESGLRKYLSKETPLFKRGKDGRLGVNEDALKFFSFEDLEIRYHGDPLKLQKMFTDPTVEQLGHAQGTKDLIRGQEDFLGAIDPKDIEIVRFKASTNYLGQGSNRPATYFDVKFSDKNFLRKPVHPESSAMVNLSLRERDFSKMRGQGLAKIIPAHWDIRDFAAVLRRTGITHPMFRAGQDFHIDQVGDFKRLYERASKLGIKEGDGLASRIGHAMDDDNLYAKLTSEQQSFVNDLREHLYEKAVQSGLSPDQVHVGPYFPHFRTDLRYSDRAGKDFVLYRSPEGHQIDAASDIPHDVPFGNLLRRSAESENIEWDVIKAAKMYITAANRRKHFKPAIEKIVPELEALNRRGPDGTYGLYQASQKFIGNFLGQYSDLDGHFDNLLGSIPGAKKLLGNRNMATRISIALTAMTYRGMLGLNPRTSLLQLHQGFVNNAMHLGLFDSVKGFFRAVAGGAGAKYSARESGVFGEAIRTLEKEYIHLTGSQTATGKAFDKIDAVLFSGIQGFDNLNRGWAYHGAYNIARRHGMSHEQAMLQGIKSANETQFIYGKLGASPLRNNPLGRVLTQFLSFGAKQMDFLARSAQREGATKAFFRYLAISGIIHRNIGKEIDVSTELAPLAPGDVANLINIQEKPAIQAFSALYDMGTAVMQEAVGVPRGKVIDAEFAKEQFVRTAMTAMFPTGTMLFGRIPKMLPTLTEAVPDEGKFLGVVDWAERGVRRDKFGRKIEDLSPQEAALGVLGFKTQDSRMRFEQLKDLKFMNDFIKRRYERLMVNAAEAAARGRDPSPFLFEAQKISGMTTRALNRSLRQRIIGRDKTPMERLLERSPRTLRE